MTAWNKAAALSRDAFRQMFLDPDTSDATVDLLRNAASGAALASTTGDLRVAGAALTGAMQRIGLNRWPRYLADAAVRAETAQNIPTVPGTQFSENRAAPGILSDHEGSGTDAGSTPPTKDWRQGEKVQGKRIPGSYQVAQAQLAIPLIVGGAQVLSDALTILGGGAIVLNAKPPQNPEPIANPPQNPVVPEGWVTTPGRVPGSVIYHPPETGAGGPDSIRVMPPGSSPVPGLKGGYWIQKQNGQPINPATGKPAQSPGEWHVPLPPGSAP